MTVADPGMAGDPAITVSDLTVEYPSHGASASCVALHGVDLRVERGEVIGLMGESGSGKSTLARVLSGQAFTGRSGDVAPQITGGDATVLGHAIRRIRTRGLRRLTFSVGLLEQDAAERLEPTLTVADNIAAPIYSRDRRYSSAAAGSRVAAMLDAVQLPLSVMTKYPFEISSGQRQRVALAQTLVLGPSILIADEPTAGIDVTVRGAVIELIGELKRLGEFTAILISHDLSVLRRLSDRVAVLHQGSLVGLGPLQSVLESPQHPYVATLAAALHTEPIAIVEPPVQRPPGH